MHQKFQHHALNTLCASTAMCENKCTTTSKTHAFNSAKTNKDV